MPNEQVEKGGGNNGPLKIFLSHLVQKVLAKSKGEERTWVSIGKGALSY